MDHIWGAPSRLKKLLAPIFLKKLAIILRQDFLRTLYVSLLSKQLRKADEQLRIYYNIRTLVSSWEYWQQQKGFWKRRQAEINDKVKERGSEYDGDN